MNKTIIIIMISFLIGLLVGAFGTHRILTAKYDRFKETYKRQLDGKLTEQEQELQQANQQLNTVNSELVKEKDLRSFIEKQFQNAERETQQMKNLIKKYKLNVESYLNTIAELQKTVEGGSGMATSAFPCSLSQQPIPYNYTLWHKNQTTRRIYLEDPDICKEGGEKITLNQIFSIKAVGYIQENGFLKTQQIWVDEIDPVTRETIDSLQVDVDASQFKYTARIPPAPVPPFKEWAFQWFKFDDPNLLVSYDTKNALGIGLELLRFWRLGTNLRYNYKFDHDNDPYKSRLSAGLVYHIGWKEVETNIGIGTSISTPTDAIGNTWIGTAELTFDLLK